MFFLFLFFLIFIILESSWKFLSWCFYLFSMELPFKFLSRLFAQFPWQQQLLCRSPMLNSCKTKLNSRYFSVVFFLSSAAAPQHISAPRTVVVWTCTVAPSVGLFTGLHSGPQRGPPVHMNAGGGPSLLLLSLSFLFILFQTFSLAAPLRFHLLPPTSFWMCMSGSQGRAKYCATKPPLELTAVITPLSYYFFSLFLLGSSGCLGRLCTLS